MLCLLAPIGLALFAGQAATTDDRPLTCGGDQEIVLSDSPARVDVRGGCCGPLYVWTDPCSADLRLRVEDASGQVVAEDEDSGGGTVPCVRLEPAPDATWRVFLLAGSSAPSVSARIHVRCAVETESTRAAARALDAQGAAASQKRKAGDFEAAHDLVSAAIDAALATEGAEDSAILADALGRAGSEAYRLGDMALAGRAWRRMLAVRERLLPPSHADRVEARLNLATVMFTLGELEAARTAQAELLADLERVLPPDAALVQAVRRNLALTLRGLNRLDEALVLTEAMLATFEKTHDPKDPDVLTAREELAALIHIAGDDPRARTLYTALLEEALAVFPAGDERLARIRLNFAVTLKALGDAGAARPLEEQALEDLARLYPPEEKLVMTARANLATTLNTLGLLDLAREKREELLAIVLRTWPESSREVQRARIDLAATLKEMGQLREALALEEAAVAALSSTLEPEHPGLLSAQQNLAATRAMLGDVRGSRAIEEVILAARLRAYPDDHADVQRARTNLGISLLQLGEIEQAAVLLRKVLEVQSRTLPEESPDLQGARLNAAAVAMELGDLLEARALSEKALAIAQDTMPRDSPDVLRLRTNLGSTLAQLGDLERAQSLFESVLEARSRSVPDDDPDLQGTRLNVANVLQIRGDLAGAQALQEKVLAVRQEFLDDDHGDLQQARLGLAGTLAQRGEVRRARELVETAIAIDEKAIAPDHPRLLAERTQLSALLEMAGEMEEAQRHARAVLEARRAALPEDHPDLQSARRVLARQCARRGDLAAATDLAREACRVLRRSLARCAATDSPREAEARADAARVHLDWILALALQSGDEASDEASDESSATLRAEAFETSEVVRAAPLFAAWMQARVARDPELDELAAASHAASAEVARLARSQSDRGAWLAARREADAAAGAIVRAVAARSGSSAPSLEVSVRDLAARLDPQSALVGYRTCTPEDLTPPGDGPRETAETLLAFVLRHDGALTLVDLGRVERVTTAVERWRDAVSAPVERGLATSARETAQATSRAAGVALRQIVLDPLAPALKDAERVVLALDGHLHAVPLDALPDEQGLRGDHCTLELRPTLVELCWPARAVERGGGLIALGGASFNQLPEGAPDDATAPPEDEGPDQFAARGGATPFTLRGGPWERAFDPLTFTAAEARGIAALYEESFGDGDGPAIVLVKRHASRQALTQLAPGARWLHVATHGWFAPQSVRSTRDPAPLDALSGLGARRSAEDEVRGLSPLVLCGLALAGANRPADPFDRVDGVVTAEEMATWDLGRCELATLSACDTNVGVRRAGLGVASLQRALHMAGARSVVASLWKVPDEATKELFLDFYRRLWVEQKPKRQALWEAKTRLRNLLDESGNPLYSTRDWAAWVLSGE